MKLIQQKCPNCGAPLQFNEDDSFISCEYCKKKIKIKKESHNTSEIYVLEVEKYYKNKYKQKISIKVMAIVVALIAIASFYLLFHFGSASSNPSEQTQEVKYVTSLSEIDTNSLNEMHRLSFEYLKKIQIEDIPQSEWKNVGMYFLKHKENSNLNKVYDVYKKEYIIDGSSVEGYVAVIFPSLTFQEDGGINIPSNQLSKESTRRNIPKVGTIYGYENSETFFNKVLRNETDKYMITCTEGLYIEKIGK